MKVDLENKYFHGLAGGIEGYDIPITDIDGNVLEFSKEEMLEDDEKER